VIVPLVFDVALLYVLLIVLPAANDAPLLTALRSAPELAAYFVPIVTLAFGWGIVRTVMYVRLLLRLRSSPAV
jgi:hypothetical protein